MIQRVRKKRRFELLVRVNGSEYNEWFLSFLVDYGIFRLGWGSEDRKMVPEFYERNLWIMFLF